MGMGKSWSAHALSTLPGTLSGPAAFLGFIARSARLTSCSLTVSGVELGGGGVGMGARLHLVPMHPFHRHAATLHLDWPLSDNTMPSMSNEELVLSRAQYSAVKKFRL